MKLNARTLIRQGERSVDLCTNATDAAILVVGPVLVQSVRDYTRTDLDVGLLTTAEREARGDMESATLKFANDYDKTTSSILGRMPFAELPGRASTMTTPDDVLNAGRKVENLLEGIAGVDETHPVDGEGEAAPRGPEWAVSLLKQYKPQLAPVAKKHAEARRLAEALKETVDERARHRALLEGHLVSFRKIVKDVHGRKSRQYRQLRGRGTPGDGETDKPAEPPPTTALVPA